MPDEQNLAVFENDFAVAEKPMAAVLMSDHPAGGDQCAPFRTTAERKSIESFAHYGISTTATP
ncbi:hypothetical protein U8C44_30905 [Sinorhizobium meliloti]|nr:hypothetical protein U8C44_30905 [Sinorhizobium meliloti]